MTFVAIFAVWLVFLVFVMGLCRAAAFGDRLLDVPRDASGRSPQRPAHADPLEEWDSEAELNGLKWWDWER